MKIVTVRRISQTFFLILFLWFCLVSSFGFEWWQLRGWPANWFLQLDPLVALGTALTTGTVYSGLIWALATVILTILFGRFFCGWVCPFGSMHQLTGYLAGCGEPLQKRIARNRYSQAQSIKYYILLFLLSAAAGALFVRIVKNGLPNGGAFWLPVALTVAAAALTSRRITRSSKKAAGALIVLLSGWTILGFLFSVDGIIGASLQTGLLDPIPLVSRSVNLVLLPILDASHRGLSINQRYYAGTWLIGGIFIATILLNLKKPRFYCRYICPLGALYGVLGNITLWRIGKNCSNCAQCDLCEAKCEGACEPAGKIRIPECVLCMNCLDECKHDALAYQTAASASGEMDVPDLSRRGVMVAVGSGVLAAPIMRMNGYTAQNWDPAVIRPPGALAETDFLNRCIKCGQCMRVCPTNIIQPAGMEAGLEVLWTPTLNFRIGTSGCQLNCIACSHICPTAAIRPISIDEKLGRAAFVEKGPIRMGMAFVDHGRCLPWAMDKPCIVCQENCPVSPKAIFLKEYFSTVRGGALRVDSVDGFTVQISGIVLRPGQFATGDYFVRSSADSVEQRSRILDNTERVLKLASGGATGPPPSPGSAMEIQVRLQRPQVDPEKCTGCGVCEHECPVSGQRAIRVSAENESRSKRRSVLL